MSIEEYVEKKKNIQQVLLEYIDGESNVEENYETLIQVLKEQHIIEERHDTKEMLYLISNIGNNHPRSNTFFHKLELILQHLKETITKLFSNNEIFEIFKNNKRILLFLIKEQIFLIDENFISTITNGYYIGEHYFEYFYPEIKNIFTEEIINNYYVKISESNNFIVELRKEIPSDFYSKRKKGENDNYLCQIIRTKRTKEFIVHIIQNNIPLDSYIPTSIYETNQLFLKDNKIKIIEYAAFFGSNEIIKYIRNEGIEIPSSIWFYAIHSGDAELIKYLEDEQIPPPRNDYENILRESIKSHHNDVSTYIINYLIKEEDLQNDIINKFYNNLYRFSFEYRNYFFFPEDMRNKFIFYYLCEFDYFTLVNLYLTNFSIDINATVIQGINIINEIHQIK